VNGCRASGDLLPSERDVSFCKPMEELVREHLIVMDGPFGALIAPLIATLQGASRPPRPRCREIVVTKPFRVLCAVDASPPAAAAFGQALALSAHRNAQLVVVHAVSKDGADSWGVVERVAALAALRERAEALNVPVSVRVKRGDTGEVEQQEWPWMKRAERSSCSRV
jgi:hypothetical protein